MHRRPVGIPRLGAKSPHVGVFFFVHRRGGRRIRGIASSVNFNVAIAPGATILGLFRGDILFQGAQTRRAVEQQGEIQGQFVHGVGVVEGIGIEIDEIDEFRIGQAGIEIGIDELEVGEAFLVQVVRERVGIGGCGGGRVAEDFVDREEVSVSRFRHCVVCQFHVVKAVLDKPVIAVMRMLLVFPLIL